MKIVCDIPVTLKAMGYSSWERLKRDCESAPNLRPCCDLRPGQRLGAWAEKKSCLKCKHCEKVIEEKE